MQEIKPVTKYREALYDRILDTAMHAFAAKGIRSVKMDDIARQLNISKRTLYEIFEDKEDLLFAGVKKFTKQRQAELRRQTLGSKNVMDIILTSYRMKVDELRQTSPAFYADLERYPRVKAFFSEERAAMYQNMEKFVKRGMREGYFRRDISHVMCGHLFEAIIMHVRQQSLFQLYSVEDIFKHMLFVSLRGICTPKGVIVLDEMLKQQ